MDKEVVKRYLRTAGSSFKLKKGVKYTAEECGGVVQITGSDGSKMWLPFSAYEAIRNG